MKNTGDILALSCSDIYYFNEFFILEQREPYDLVELRIYITRSSLATILSPNIFFQTESKETPIDDSKIQKLKIYKELLSGIKKWYY